jgi:LPS export ABC transporter protein LptC
MNWRWISITALLAALVIGYGAFNRRDAAPDFLSAVPERPTYYLRNAVITETQEDGSLITQLAATRIDLQPTTEDLSMQSVNLHYHQSADQEWRMTAEEGFKPGNSPIIELRGNVQLRPADGDANSILQADELAVDTEKEVAYSTDSPVNIRYANHTLRAESFQFDMQKQKLSMRSAKGSYGDP